MWKTSTLWKEFGESRSCMSTCVQIPSLSLSQPGSASIVCRNRGLSLLRSESTGKMPTCLRASCMSSKSNPGLPARQRWHMPVHSARLEAALGTFRKLLTSFALDALDLRANLGLQTCKDANVRKPMVARASLLGMASLLCFRAGPHVVASPP